MKATRSGFYFIFLVPYSPLGNLSVHCYNILRPDVLPDNIKTSIVLKIGSQSIRNQFCTE